jgi:hypothetical protein
MDVRVKYYLEAMDNIRAANDHGIDSMDYWANVACAISNGVMALLPDDLAEEVQEELARRTRLKRQAQRRTQARVKRELKKS